LADGAPTARSILRRQVAAQFKVPRVVRRKGESKESFILRYEKKESKISELCDNQQRLENSRECRSVRDVLEVPYGTICGEMIAKEAIEGRCSMCGDVDDSLKHCFERCEVAQKGITEIRCFLKAAAKGGSSEAISRKMSFAEILGILSQGQMSTEAKWCTMSAIYDTRNAIRWRKARQSDVAQEILGIGLKVYGLVMT
jgi:hypothetical protein